MYYDVVAIIRTKANNMREHEFKEVRAKETSVLKQFNNKLLFYL